MRWATRPSVVYTLVALVGAASFLYPFWLPAEALPGAAHAGDAPLVAAALGALVVTAAALELRNGTMNGASVAILGVLAGAGGLLRIVDPPGGANGIFFLVILAAVAFGARFGALLGLLSMAAGAVVTGGIGPWLPYQMLSLAAVAALAGGLGALTRRWRPRPRLVALAAFGWIAGFLYGAVMNLSFWPYLAGDGPLAWRPGLGFVTTAQHYWSFYVTTSFAWDAAGAATNAVLILSLGPALLAAFGRAAARLEPVVVLDDRGPLQPSNR